MPTDRLEGLGHQVKGTFKENIGIVIGDSKLTADGAAERIAGDEQNVPNPDGDQLAGVDTDRIAGIGHQLRGLLKTGLGRILGDALLQQKGRTEQAAGKVQNAAGGVRDEAREAIERQRVAVTDNKPASTP
jgi:uncharacterized protein YjbJ (UPF0337 family)